MSCTIWSADISEATNVAAEHADVVERLLKFGKDYDQRLQARSRPIGSAGTFGL